MTPAIEALITRVGLDLPAEGEAKLLLRCAEGDDGSGPGAARVILDVVTEAIEIGRAEVAGAEEPDSAAVILGLNSIAKGNAAAINAVLDVLAGAKTAGQATVPVEAVALAIKTALGPEPMSGAATRPS